MKNKTIIIITLVVILLPAVAGMILWNRLPDSMAIHFDISGTPDNWCHKAWVIFGLPLFMLAAQWFCVFMTSRDPKHENTGRKILGVVIWICPSCSLFAGVILYSYSLNLSFPALPVIEIFVGIMIMMIGNYLPKIHQNHTIGIKLLWTLNNTENWNKTHRLAGKVWLTGGLIIAVNAFFNVLLISLAVMLLLVLIPLIYSFAYSRKHV